MYEKITTRAQWTEATRFLADLADDGNDGLGDAATVKPEEMARDARGTIIEVIATVVADDGERQRKRFSTPVPMTAYYFGENLHPIDATASTSGGPVLATHNFAQEYRPLVSA